MKLGCLHIASNETRVDSRTMQVRATFAGLLMVLMLSVSFFASACEVRCDLMSAGPSCHSTAQQSASQQAKSMATMPGMSESDAAATSGDQNSARVSEVCHHAVCVQQPVVITEKNVPLKHARLHVELLTLNIFKMLSSPQQNFIRVESSPPARSSTPVALSTTLRV